MAASTPVTPQQYQPSQASQLAGKARDAAANVAGRARDAASSLGSRAEDATFSVGNTMQSLAGTMRDKVPQGGMLGNVASTVAGTLESSGRYLQQEGLQGMAESVTNMIRRNPIPAMIVGVGLGCFLARVTSRS